MSDFEELSQDLQSSDEETIASKKVHLFEPGDVRYALENDPYDGFVLSLVCLSDPTYVESHRVCPSVLQLVFSASLLAISNAISLGLVISILITTTQSIADKFNENLVNKTATINAALATVPPVRLPDDDPAVLQCLTLQCLPFAHFLILFVWGAKMTEEFVHVLWRFALLLNLPLAKHGEKLMDENDSGSIVITHQTMPLRLVNMFMVVLPEGIIAFLLYWTGAKFLLYAQNMGTLVMKSVSLFFIVHIDELMFSAFASLRMKVRLKRSVYMYRVERPNWHGVMWGASLTKLVVVVLSCVLVHEVVFRDVTLNRRACHEYFAAFPKLTPIRGADSFVTSLLRGLDLKK